MNVRVESADKADMPLFISMEQEVGTREFIMPDEPDVHQQRFTDPGIVYLRIVSDQELAGFFILAMDTDGRSVEFRRVVVKSKGLGIGQLAISAMEDYCRSQLRRTRIWLDVFAHNTRGRHIYEKLGYRQYGERASEDKPLLLYEKQLDSGGTE